MTRAGWKFATVATVITGAAIAGAQPAPPDPIATDPPVQPRPIPAGTPADGGPLLGGAGDPPPIPSDPYQQPVRPPHHNPDRPIDMPTLLTTPTGWLLPAAVLYSKTSIDTGGGVSSDQRIGLGDVAEFGLSTTDQVREKFEQADKTTSQIEPYLTATFRMGVAEGRLFDQQPGLALGFEKSFEHTHNGFKTRIAELTLVASKKVGDRTAFHLGGAFWDASLAGTNTEGVAVDTSLHDRGSGYALGNQIRVFGGIQVRPIAKSEILVDLGWAPEFCYGCAAPDQIRLRPELSWGVRYEVADWMHIESGVRVPDIGSANLLNAQIFGALTFTSWGLRHAVDALK
jgi:hypothetical protein